MAAWKRDTAPRGLAALLDQHPALVVIHHAQIREDRQFLLGQSLHLTKRKEAPRGASMGILSVAPPEPLRQDAQCPAAIQVRQAAGDWLLIRRTAFWAVGFSPFAMYSGVAKWQATRCPPPTSMKSGSFCLQISAAKGQRV